MALYLQVAGSAKSCRKTRKSIASQGRAKRASRKPCFAWRVGSLAGMLMFEGIFPRSMPGSLSQQSQSSEFHSTVQQSQDASTDVPGTGCRGMEVIPRLRGFYCVATWTCWYRSIHASHTSSPTSWSTRFWLPELLPDLRRIVDAHDEGQVSTVNLFMSRSSFSK